MEYIEHAVVLKDFIEKNISKNINVEYLSKFIARELGKLIAKLHSKNIIHGDLTSSNVLLQNVNEELSIEKYDGTQPLFIDCYNSYYIYS